MWVSGPAATRVPDDAPSDPAAGRARLGAAHPRGYHGHPEPVCIQRQATTWPLGTTRCRRRAQFRRSAAAARADRLRRGLPVLAGARPAGGVAGDQDDRVHLPLRIPDRARGRGCDLRRCPGTGRLIRAQRPAAAGLRPGDRRHPPARLSRRPLLQDRALLYGLGHAPP